MRKEARERPRHTCDRVLGSHFTEKEESDIDDEANDGVADEHARRATL